MKNLSSSEAGLKKALLIKKRVDVKVAGRGLDKLEQSCDLFNSTNLIRYETCFTRNHKSIIHLILTNNNKLKSFQNTFITETGLSVFHKLIWTFFKTCQNLSETKNSFLP